MRISLVILSCLHLMTIRAQQDEDSTSSNYFDGKPGPIYSLRLAHVLFRHGDRSPIHAYANDIYNETDWPQGFGQLSITGMQQEYELGMFLRDRYMHCYGIEDLGIDCNGFLSPTYERNEMYVRSTSFDRTLMSVYNVLSALYPPQGSDLEEDNLTMPYLFNAWQPIPVHTVPIEEDHLLCTDSLCPLFIQEKAAFAVSPELDEIKNKYNKLFETVSQYSGEENSLNGTSQVIDPLYCQKVSNYPLPDWVTDDIFNELLELKEAHTEFWIPKDIAYLRGGPLVKQMMEHMTKMQAFQDDSLQHLFIYSAHDSTVVSLLQTLDLFNNKVPHYTACVLVELFESDDGFFVQVSYRNETDSDPYILTIDGCDEMCPLDSFLRIYMSLQTLDIEKACAVNSSEQVHSSPVLPILNIILVMFILLAMILFVILILCIRNKSRNSVNYMPVPTEMTEIELR
ncbi:prostatic acid phosphatase-like [Mya arenaria]|uniref:prostatic acid phosphatase-like n=1 Tax=Mya arenaria TaxID=6604 RepID=UPI0022E20FD9|nr:prostatic acid phosphatase-like [Mya arenaria]